MEVKKLDMEYWFMKAASAKYNFSESGVPDFTLKEFFRKIKVNSSMLDDIYLGNNDTRGSLEFRKEIAGLYKRVRPKDLIVTNGTSEVLYILFNLFLGKQTKILLLHPAFPPLYLIPQSLGVKVDYFDVLKFKSKTGMFKNLIHKIKELKPHLLIINVPHNPTGFNFDNEEMAVIGKVVKEYGGTILFDEHYRFLPISRSVKVLPSGYDVVSSFYKKVFAVGSIIKCTGIVGSRVGWLIADGRTLNKVRDYKDYTTHCVPLINETLAKLAIRNMSKITKGFIDIIKDNWLSLKKSKLVEKGRVLLNYELEGGCIYFPGIRGINSLALAKRLLDKYSISVLPGDYFNCPGYIRINLSQKAGSFKYLLQGIEKII